MAIEGFILYQMVIVVFESGKDHRIIHYAVAYGTPVIIVTITGIISEAKSDHAYGGDA